MTDLLAHDRIAVPNSPPPPGFVVREHHGCHRSLVPRARERFLAGGVVGPGIDVVAVPAARAAANLHQSAAVAAELDVPLVVLASRETVPAAAHEVARVHLPSDRIVIVTQNGKWHVPRVMLTADTEPTSRGRTSDTSAKRNLAIAMARMCGWERVLFVDDDVSGFGRLETDTVRRALADGTGLEAVGWTFDRFPDNSMVCHAYRLAGAEQSTFIGAGALAVRVAEHTPHFPLVYNEDWLFMLPLMLRQEVALARAGSLTQDRFDPFARPGDAVKQEFGDVLGEGLFRLVHLGMDISAAQTRGYWRTVLRIRAELIERTADRLARGLGRRCPATQLVEAVQALHEASASYCRPIAGPTGIEVPWIDALASWVVAWRHDSLTWSNYLGELPTRVGLDVALRRLRLSRYEPPSMADTPPAPTPTVVAQRPTRAVAAALT